MSTINGFTIYREYYDLITLLSDKEQANVLLAIARYMFEDKEIKLSKKESKIFINLKRPLSKSKEQSKRRTKSKPNQNQNETEKEPQLQPNKNTSNDVDVYVNVNVNNKDIYYFIEDNFGRTLSPLEVTEVDEWLLSFNEEIIKYAVKKAVLNNKRTFSYVDGILKNWKSCNYKTLQEIKEVEIKRDNKSTQSEEREKWLNE